MKKSILKVLAFTMALSLTVPTVLIPNQSVVAKAAVVKTAAVPKLNFTKLTLNGLTDSETLQVINKVTGATYSWSSSNSAVAEVNYKGDVTPVGKGTTVIRCRIKYPNKSQKVLACTVKVVVPATSIAIKNAVLGENKAHQLVIGDTVDLDYTITPAGSSYWGYWTSDNTAVATVDKYGRVTGKTEGTATIRLVAASNWKTALTSEIDDGVNVSVVSKIAKTARVESVELVSAKELILKFSAPMDATTLYNATTKVLTDNITIAKNVVSDSKTTEPGKLTGSLSADMKTLTVTPENTFLGTYKITLSKAVTTTDKVALTPYVETISLSDTVKPTYKGTSVDDTGVMATISFSEAIDINGLEIASALVGDAEPSLQTSNVVKSKNNYVISADKKSLKINLSGIATVDQNKGIVVVLSGIKDLAGNFSDPPVIPVTLYTDTTAKPQAKIQAIRRSAYSVLSVEYDRAIKTVGLATLGGSSLYGVVDTNNNKIVNYTLNASQSLLKGIQSLSVGYWDSYNVAATDLSARTYYNLQVNFDVDTAAPFVLSYDITPVINGTTTNYNLALTFNEPVMLNSTSGSFTTSLKASNGNVLPNVTLNYTAVATDNVVTLTFLGAQMATAGNYSTDIPAGFVKDLFYNPSTVKNVVFSQNGANGQELPGPTSVLQSAVNHNEIYLTFGNKLDIPSAENANNYAIPGIAVTSATLVSQTDAGASVKLTVAPGSIKYTGTYPLTITGVKGYNDTYRAIVKSEKSVILKENVAPQLLSAKISQDLFSVTLTYNESLSGVPKFLISQNGKILNSDTSPISISNNTVVIYLVSQPVGTAGISVSTSTNNSLADVNGNLAATTTFPVN